MVELFTLIVLCAVGIIGVIQWTKEFLNAIIESNINNLCKILLSFILSGVCGFLIWKIKYADLSYYMAVLLSLSVLSIVQLGYETIIKYIHTAIESTLKKVLINDKRQYK